VQGDALEPADVRRAAEGARVIVHAANPPGYRNWSGLVLPMLQSSIAAARAEGARLLLPGNVYNFGPDAFPRLSEDSPQHPSTGKGAIRVEMEARLARAAEDGVKSLVLRAGDFFGPGAGPNWMSAAMVRPGEPLKAVTYPGPLGVRRAWAYLPDLGEAAARLLAVEDELAAFARFHFEGHAVDGHEMVRALEQLAGRRLPVRPFPWPALWLAGPFNETMRGLVEMRHLWRDEVVLDGARLASVIGPEPRTRLSEALATSLTALRVPLPETAAKAA
jgi:nucleoside-diphosphate-sugar epimerase